MLVIIGAGQLGLWVWHDVVFCFAQQPQLGALDPVENSVVA